jgi:hypothetical protein
MSLNSSVVGRNVSHGRYHREWTQDELAVDPNGFELYQDRRGVESTTCFIHNSMPKDRVTRQLNTVNSPSAADSPMVGGGKS